MTKQQHEQLKNSIKKINAMSQKELKEYRTKVSLSNAHNEVKKKIYEACDAKLQGLDIRKALAIGGDTKDLLQGT